MFGKDIYREASEIRTQISCVAQRTSIEKFVSYGEYDVSEQVLQSAERRSENKNGNLDCLL
jgi:hypothetical protein